MDDDVSGGVDGGSGSGNDREDGDVYRGGKSVAIIFKNTKQNTV